MFGSAPFAIATIAANRVIVVDENPDIDPCEKYPCSSGSAMAHIGAAAAREMEINDLASSGGARCRMCKVSDPKITG
jgi:hypothetical protein